MKGEAHDWYVARTLPHAEQVVSDRLKSELGFEPYVPMALTEESRRGRVVSVPRPAFSGYVLVKMPAATEAWRAATDTRGISELLGSDDNGRPTPVPAGQVEVVKYLERHGKLRLSGPPHLAKGDRVRIKFGHLVDFEGTFQRKNKQLAYVEVRLLGRKIDVPIPVRALELVADGSGATASSRAEKVRKNRPSLRQRLKRQADCAATAPLLA